MKRNNRANLEAHLFPRFLDHRLGFELLVGEGPGSWIEVSPRWGHRERYKRQAILYSWRVLGICRAEEEQSTMSTLVLRLLWWTRQARRNRDKDSEIACISFFLFLFVFLSLSLFLRNTITLVPLTTFSFIALFYSFLTFDKTLQPSFSRIPHLLYALAILLSS